MKFAHVHIFFLALFVLAACSEPVPDETRIRQRIEAMSAATADKDMSGVLAPVHEDFLGNERIRKANLKGIVLLHFQRHKHVHVLVTDIEITLNGNQADVSCKVVLAGRTALLPEEGRVLVVDSSWQKIDDDWYVVSAKWQDPFLQ